MLKGSVSRNLVRLYLIAQALQDERVSDSQQMKERDRAIGKKIEHHQSATKIALWFDEVASEDIREKEALLTRQLQFFSGLCILGALIAGWGTGLLAFEYDGSTPVNILPILCLFAVLPFLFCILQFVVLIPAGRSSVVRQLMSKVRAISPGQLLRIPAYGKNQDLSQQVASWSARHKDIFGELEAFTAFVFWQLLIAIFLLGIVLHGLKAGLTSDLAFSWSLTPQNITPTEVHWYFTQLSLPWAWVLPDLVPSLALVEDSRLYRLNSLRELDPRVLAQWWSYVLLSISTWGVAPRLLLFMLGISRLKTKLRQKTTALPGALDLLDRLEMPLVETTGSENLETRTTALPASPDSGNQERFSLAALVTWNLGDFQQVDWQSLFEELNFKHITHAEGLGDVDRLCHDLKEFKQAFQVVLLVKSWEPPLKEVWDFTQQLKRRVPQLREVRIALLDIPQDNKFRLTLSAPAWEHTLNLHHDPYISLLARGEQS